MWENSKYISRQLDKIGLSLSTTLVNAGMTTFEKLQNTGPRELELVSLIITRNVTLKEAIIVAAG